MTNELPYDEWAAIVKARPDTWVTVREGLSSANIVTKINSGQHKDFPAELFSARSKYRSGRYNIEIKYDGLSDVMQTVFLDRITQEAISQIGPILAASMVEYGRLTQANQSAPQGIVLEIVAGRGTTSLHEACMLLQGLDSIKMSFPDAVLNQSSVTVYYEGHSDQINELKRRHDMVGQSEIMKSMTETASGIYDMLATDALRRKDEINVGLASIREHQEIHPLYERFVQVSESVLEMTQKELDALDGKDIEEIPHFPELHWLVQGMHRISDNHDEYWFGSDGKEVEELLATVIANRKQSETD